MESLVEIHRPATLEAQGVERTAAIVVVAELAARGFELVLNFRVGEQNLALREETTIKTDVLDLDTISIEGAAIRVGEGALGAAQCAPNMRGLQAYLARSVELTIQEERPADPELRAVEGQAERSCQVTAGEP